MSEISLKNKPLVEAIFELRWKLNEVSQGVLIDKNYKLLIGRMFEKIKTDYPVYNTLQSVSIPDEMAAHIVQHQYRFQEDGWPLVQLGPGIITVNDCEKYTWTDFEGRIKAIIRVLYEIYPNGETAFQPESLLLRYIDADYFDYANENIFDFLRNGLKTEVKMHEGLFDKTGVNRLPFGLDLRFSFLSSAPKGAAKLRFVRGKKNDRDALIWETIVHCAAEDTPKDEQTIMEWVNNAHDLTHDWFFKMIDGKLREKYQ